jgi:hypothetical protein
MLSRSSSTSSARLTNKALTLSATSQKKKIHRKVNVGAKFQVSRDLCFYVLKAQKHISIFLFTTPLSWLDSLFQLGL